MFCQASLIFFGIDSVNGTSAAFIMMMLSEVQSRMLNALAVEESGVRGGQILYCVSVVGTRFRVSGEIMQIEYFPARLHI